MAIIEIENIKKSYDKVEVLKEITFNVNNNDVVAVIGPSGSGKSTMLRCLVDLEKIDGGTIRVSGDELVKDGIYAPQQKSNKLQQEWEWFFSILIYSHILL